MGIQATTTRRGVPAISLFVDTSVWSLVLRRDSPPKRAETLRLGRALEGGEGVYVTGLVLQEILQGVRGPRFRERIVSDLSLLPFLVPDRVDHVEAAGLRNECARKGVQIGTIDALLAQLCIRHGLDMLTVDEDFKRIARHFPLSVWGPS
ncbi:MAG: PIN domain-containing protein [Planctomycetes bacterium]|nr:PIN domain-containing protein [Planctomycetota bacterium]